MMKCPGQDTQYWTEDAIYEVKCPKCQNQVEFYRDDTTRKCNHCQHRFVNPKMDFGCATYCQFAEQCLGTLPEEFVLQQDNLLKDKVAVEMKRHLRTDFRSIGLAVRIAHYAEKIARANEGVNLAVVLCAAYLLPLSMVQGGNAGDGAALAGEILRKLKADETLVARVCSIVEDPFTSAPDHDRERIMVNDAHQLALLERDLKESRIEEEQFPARLAAFMSTSGKDEANALFLTLSS